MRYTLSCRQRRVLPAYLPCLHPHPPWLCAPRARFDEGSTQDGRSVRPYPLATVLAIATAAKLAGYHGVTAFAEFAQALSQEQLRALRAYYSHRLGRFTAPTVTTVTTFHNILTALDPDVLDRAVRTWAAQRSAGQEPVAIDGKSVLVRHADIPSRPPLCPIHRTDHDVCVREEVWGFPRYVTRADTCAVTRGD